MLLNVQIQKGHANEKNANEIFRKMKLLAVSVLQKE